MPGGPVLSELCCLLRSWALAGPAGVLSLDVSRGLLWSRRGFSPLPSPPLTGQAAPGPSGRLAGLQTGGHLPSPQE